MDNNGHRENGRHKPPQGQWLMQQHQPSMKQIMGIMAERDAAIQERNLALSEKKAAIAERDLAMLQRDTAIAERNNAIIERDNAIATLQYRETSPNNGNLSTYPPSFQIPHGVKHMHHHPGEASSYGSMDILPMNDPIAVSPVSCEPPKPRRAKRAKDTKDVTATKRTTKSTKKLKKEDSDLNTNAMFGNSDDWKPGQEMGSGSDDHRLVLVKPDWKNQDLGLNQVAFDETTMSVPVCSCTGVFRTCYKWGNGGWQSSCCTTNISMYPLPAVPNKRHARIGGRKMSGSAFTKLLSRLAAEGHDLSNPVDLKEHWAKHGTNRYITIK